MATVKQIEANQRNAQKSTGPRTQQGKEAARYNSLIHGFRAKGMDILPHEDPALFQDRIDAWFADYNPTNETEAQLVRHAAVLSWKLDRAESHEAACLRKRVSEAMAQAETANRNHLADAIEGLMPEVVDGKMINPSWEPADELLETIEGSAAGCKWLLGRWQRIRTMIKQEKKLIDSFVLEAIRLFGSGPAWVADPKVLDFVVANRMAWHWSPEFELPRELSGPSGFSLDRGRLREAWFRRPGSQAEAVTFIMAAADGEIARLEGVLATRERDGAAGLPEIAEAAEIASFDPGPEGERIRKYQAALHREFIKTVETISKLRLQLVKLDLERTKLAMIGANEPNSVVGDSDEHESGTPRGPQPGSPPEIGASEPNLAPETEPSEANATVDVQLLFGPEPVRADQATSPTATNEPNRPRAMTRRERAMARRMKKAKTGR